LKSPGSKGQRRRIRRANQQGIAWSDRLRRPPAIGKLRGYFSSYSSTLASSISMIGMSSLTGKTRLHRRHFRPSPLGVGRTDSLQRGQTRISRSSGLRGMDCFSCSYPVGQARKLWSPPRPGQARPGPVGLATAIPAGDDAGVTASRSSPGGLRP